MAHLLRVKRVWVELNPLHLVVVKFLLAEVLLVKGLKNFGDFWVVEEIELLDSFSVLDVGGWGLFSGVAHRGT